MLFQGVDNQSGISDRMPMPVDITADTAYVNTITGETVQLLYFNSGVPTTDAGQAAGTVVVAKLAYTNILDRIGAMSGNDLETSLSWTTNTVLPLANIQPCPKWAIEAADNKTLSEIATDLTANFTNGQWCLDHRHGVIYGKKATTGTSDTATYKVQTTYTSGGGSVAADVNISKVANTSVSAKDAVYSEAPLGVGGEFEVLGSLTTDGSAAGDKVPFKCTSKGVQYVQITNETVPLDILTQDAAFGTGSRGLAVFGKYMATPTTYTDGDAVPVLLDAQGRIVLSSDIQIGAVELKNGADDARATIDAANTARTTATTTLVTQPIDAAGNVLGRTAANTARTTGTLVDPVQIVDAAGNVINISAANTARTTGTLVLPTQHIGADGTVSPTGSLNTNAPFVKLTDGTTDLILGTGTVKTVPCELSDGTTNVDVIATINSLKSDISSVGGEAIVADNGAGAGVTKVVPIGGKYNATAPTYSDGDVVMAQFDLNGALRVNSNSSEVTLASTAALATNLVVKASAGVLIGFSGINNSASAQYVQVHNTASLPADTAVPVIVIKVDAGENFYYSSDLPVSFATGITICNSSTIATKTIGAADCWIQAEYI